MCLKDYFPKKGSVTVSARIPEDLALKVKAILEAENRGYSDLIVAAFLKYLDECEKKDTE